MPGRFRESLARFQARSPTTSDSPARLAAPGYPINHSSTAQPNTDESLFLAAG